MQIYKCVTITIIIILTRALIAIIYVNAFQISNHNLNRNRNLKHIDIWNCRIWFCRNFDMEIRAGKSG